MSEQYEVLQCFVTGKRVYINEDQLRKKIEKFGSIDNVRKYHACREALNLLIEGLTVSEVRERLEITEQLPDVSDEVVKTAVFKKTGKKFVIRQQTDDGQKWWQHPDFRISKQIMLTPLDVESATKDTCLTPNAYLDDDCERCIYFNRCSLPIRKIRGKIQKKSLT